MRNVARDRQSMKALESLGWHVLVIWECETQDVEKLSLKLKNVLGEAKNIS